jgi:excinuclease ABC subunit C
MAVQEINDDAEILRQFLERYYLDVEDIPREIFLQQELEEHETIEQWLSGRRGDNVGIVVPKIGEKAKLIAMCKSNAKFLLDELKIQKLKREDFIPHALAALQRDLRLAKPPKRIECFDISNIQGTDTVASMVVFVNGRPKKSEYRKFKIQTVTGPDDFASMKEVVERRYSRLLEEKGDPPDLIMVDGGKGQLSSAVEILERLGLRGEGERIPIIGLAKRLEEVFVPGASDPQSLPRTSSGLKLLQQVRNEAHHFAITYHRTLRKKRTLQTELDLIKGIGKTRAKELLELFGSVQGVKFATLEQLSEVVGEKVASKIKDYFQEEETSAEV